jgi:G patch domain-containing protein 1
VAETTPVCFTAEVEAELISDSANEEEDPTSRQRSPPPQYPASEASGSSAFRPPPSFSSLFPYHGHEASESVLEPYEPYKHTVDDSGATSSVSAAAPAYAPPDQVAPESSNRASAALRLEDETKRALPQDTKSHAGEPSRSSKDEEAEPPPAYSEGSSPLQSFTYLMAAAGGASSIITQVQQGGPSLNPLGGAQRCREIQSGRTRLTIDDQMYPAMRRS